MAIANSNTNTQSNSWSYKAEISEGDNTTVPKGEMGVIFFYPEVKPLNSDLAKRGGSRAVLSWMSVCNHSQIFKADRLLEHTVFLHGQSTPWEKLTKCRDALRQNKPGHKDTRYARDRKRHGMGRPCLISQITQIQTCTLWEVHTLCIYVYMVNIVLYGQSLSKNYCNKPNHVSKLVF